MMLNLLSKDEIIKKYLELEKENEELRKQKEALEKELRNWELETVIVFAETPY